MFSICKYVFLTFIITVLPWTPLMAQDDTRYRVEVLVLTLLEPQVPAQSAAELREFADAVDLSDRQKAREVHAVVRDLRHALGDPSLLPPPPLRRTADPEGPWDDIALIEERSDRMAEVWRKLRLSAEYRPVAFLAWEQPAEGPFPALRIHNEVVIRTEDPWADARTPARSGEAGDFDLAYQYRIEEGTVSLAPVPQPKSYFTVEGTVRLRRSRFLHIDLDLESRTAGPALRMGIPGPPLRNRFQGYLVHDLVQSRQVRTERMAYFDSPALGALVWVNEIKPPQENEDE